MWFVYILRCSNGAYYVGCTQNVDVRVRAHNEGRAAAFTRRHRPVALIYTETVETELDALRREKQIKGWSRAKKEALFTGDLERLKDLSKSHD